MNRLTSSTHLKLSLTVLSALMSVFPLEHQSIAQDSNEVIRFKGNQSFKVVDQRGKPIAVSEIPEELRQRLEELEFKRTSGFGLVLGRVVLPAGEMNAEYNASVYTTRSRISANQPDLRRGTDQGVISCWLFTGDDEVQALELSKAGYKGIRIGLSNLNFDGKIIWLGDIPLEAYSRSEAVWHVVSGAVTTPQGKPLEGMVGLRVNGTQGRVMELKDGLFNFVDVTPGAYLLECAIKGHSVKTSWLSVIGDTSETLTAFPLRKYHIQVDDPKESREQWLTAGGSTGESCVRFKDGKSISFIQVGDEFKLDCEQSVKMRVADTVFPSGSYRWKGVLQKGDTVELLDRETDAVIHKITCLEVSEP